MNTKRRIVIVGASSAIAEHCARLWVSRQPEHLVLVGRDVQRLDRVISDLRVRSPESGFCAISTDFLDPVRVQSTVARIVEAGRVDIVLVAHGSLPDQNECQNNLVACRDALEINAISPVLFAEAWARSMAEADHGTLALIGSVAGDRGRKSNYVYGSAKGLVTRYAQGLQHRFANTSVRVVLIKPGPTDTPMTSHLKAAGAKLAPVESVAREIVDGIEKGRPVVYAPGIWKLIMLIIRHLPSLIFNRLDI